MNFWNTVFVNCPFTDDFRDMRQALVFVLLRLELKPRFCSEQPDSFSQRMDNLKELIQECRFSVHDLSLVKARKKGEVARMNMPFELGLDAGCRHFGGGESASKRTLVLTADKRKLEKALSDFSGNDVRSHKADERTLIDEVRNYFYTLLRNEKENTKTTYLWPLPGATDIWQDYGEFLTSLQRNEDGSMRSAHDVDVIPLRKTNKTSGFYDSF